METTAEGREMYRRKWEQNAERHSSSLSLLRDFESLRAAAQAAADALEAMGRVFNPLTEPNKWRLHGEALARLAEQGIKPRND